MKKIDKVIFLLLIPVLGATLIAGGKEIFKHAHKLQLNHTDWIQYNPNFSCNEEPIWGPQDAILGWHLIDDAKTKHFMFIKLNNDPPPDLAWIACNGYKVVVVPDKVSKKTGHHNKILFSFINCINGGSTIVDSTQVKIDGAVEIPTETWANSFGGTDQDVEKEKNK